MNIRMSMFLAAFAVLSPLAWGQEEAAKQDLLKALGKLEKSTTSLTGKVGEVLPEEDQANPLGGVQRIVVSSMGGGAAIRIGGNAPKPKGDREIDLGKLVTFTFSKSQGPTARMTEFVKHGRELLKTKWLEAIVK